MRSRACSSSSRETVDSARPQRSGSNSTATRREVSLRQQLFTTIAQSYEQARIDEVRDTPVFTVIEQPVVPVGPDPRYFSLKVVLGAVLGLFLGMLAAVIRDYLTRGSDDPGDARGEFAILLRQAGGDLRHPLRAVGRAFARPVAR